MFIANIEYLYHHLLYKLYLNNNTVEIINNYNYQEIIISPLLLITNQEAINIMLYLEAWHNLYLYLKDERNIDNIYIENKELSLEQNQVINHYLGPQLVLSSAGSGKTKTLVEMIKNLLKKGISKEEILVLTYNTKAKEEIINRLNNIKMDIHTYHSFGDKIIKQNTEWYFINEDKEIEYELINKLIIEEDLNLLNDQKTIIEISNIFTNIKNNLLTKESLIMKKGFKQVNLTNLFIKYLENLNTEGFYNYDDMLYLSLMMLLKVPQLRKYYQNKYSFILIDEYQDINPVQKMLVKVLNLPFLNTTIFGDDDQTIYSFRGANYQNILKIKEEYPMCKINYLNTNFRSLKQIVNKSKRLIDYNINRFDKKIKPYHHHQGVAYLKIFKNELEQIKYIISILNTKNNLTILYRYNKDGELLHLFLTIHGFCNDEDLFNKLLNLNKKNIIQTIYHLINEYMTYDEFIKYVKTHLTSFKKEVKHYTIHKTKGKEFKNVILFNVLDLPINSDIEEERRIFYVAATRAKRTLIVTKNKSSNNMFIYEYFLSPNLKDYSNKELNKHKEELLLKIWELNKIKYLKAKDLKYQKDYLVTENNYYKMSEMILNNYEDDLNKYKNEYQLIREELYYRNILKR